LKAASTALPLGGVFNHYMKEQTMEFLHAKPFLCCPGVPFRRLSARIFSAEPWTVPCYGTWPSLSAPAGLSRSAAGALFGFTREGRTLMGLTWCVALL
jgi:hypothetical protein